MARPQKVSPTRSENRSRRRCWCSCLLQFHQRAEKILWMKKKHRLAVRADLWLAVTENTRALLFERIARGANIGNFVAYVMDTTVRITFEKFCNRRIRA